MPSLAPSLALSAAMDAALIESLEHPGEDVILQWEFDKEDIRNAAVYQPTGTDSVPPVKLYYVRHITIPARIPVTSPSI
jgi:hypothetical protein